MEPFFNQLLSVPIGAHDPVVVDVTWPRSLVWGVLVPSLVSSALGGGRSGIQSRSAMRTGGEAGVVESMRRGTVGDPLRQVRVIPTRGRFAVGLCVAEAEMPFADQSSGIALRLKKGTEGGAVLFDQRVALNPKKDPVLHPCPPGIAPGQQAIAGRCATGGWSVGVGEEHAHVGELLHGRGLELLTVRVLGEELISRGIAHPHVISHEEHDVRTVGNLSEGKKGKEEK